MTLENRLAWWQSARYGLFVHWGLYALPAGWWKGDRVKGLGEWVQRHAKIPADEYAALATQFDPQSWDADAVARLAADAGMKYLVYTAKHHDGFAMYHSKVSPFNIVDATPYGRDPLAGLVAACRKYDVVPCVYYSQDLDWHEPDGGGNDWDFDPTAKNFQRYLDDKVFPQLTELLTNYGRIGLVWFDLASGITREQSRAIRDHVHALQPACLVSGRVGHGMGDYGNLGDNQFPLSPVRGAWECPATVNSTWGYVKGDEAFKTPRQVLELLIDLASKNVNYLLNIGPDSSGHVPDRSADVLRGAGRWMAINGEAIHGTVPGGFLGEPDWGRATRRGRSLYFILNDWPADGRFGVRGIDGRVERAVWLGDPSTPLEHRSVELDAGLRQLTVGLPPRPADDAAGLFPVLRVDFAVEPRVDPTPSQRADAGIYLPAAAAVVHATSDNSGRRRSDTGNFLAAADASEKANSVADPHRMGVGVAGSTENWFSPTDFIEWPVRIERPGTFRVRLNTMSEKYRPWVGGASVAVDLNGIRVCQGLADDHGRVNKTRNKHYEEATTDLGVLSIATPGLHRLTLRATDIPDSMAHGLCLTQMDLLPA